MTQPEEIFLMTDASEGVPYLLVKPRAAKKVIESKHQPRSMPGDFQWVSCRLGGMASVIFDLNALMTSRKETLDSLHTFSS
jgi:hypothetical protein